MLDWESEDESGDGKQANEMLVVTEHTSHHHGAGPGAEDEQTLLVQQQTEKTRAKWLSEMMRSLRKMTPALSGAVDAYALLRNEEEGLRKAQVWFGDLPLEVLLQVLGNLSCADLGRFSLVSRQCRALALSPVL